MIPYGRMKTFDLAPRVCALPTRRLGFVSRWVSVKAVHKEFLSRQMEIVVPANAAAMAT
jgi:hypothetical protein